MIEFNHLPEMYHTSVFQSIANAERENLLPIQKQYFKPKHCIISASGSTDLLEPILRQYGETIIFQES